MLCESERHQLKKVILVPNQTESTELRGVKTPSVRKSVMLWKQRHDFKSYSILGDKFK